MKGREWKGEGGRGEREGRGCERERGSEEGVRIKTEEGKEKSK